MPRTKQKSEFVSGLGSAFEFVKAISDEVKKLGGNDDDLRKVITQSSLCYQVATTIIGKMKLDSVDFVFPGFRIIEDVDQSSFNIAQLKFRSFMKDDDGVCIDNQTMRSRAISMKGNLGLADAKYLFYHQEEIPSNIRNKVIIFPGTVLYWSNHILSMPYLYWGEEVWRLYFVKTENLWDDQSCLACIE